MLKISEWFLRVLLCSSMTGAPNLAPGDLPPHLIQVIKVFRSVWILTAHCLWLKIYHPREHLCSMTSLKIWAQENKWIHFIKMRVQTIVQDLVDHQNNHHQTKREKKIKLLHVWKHKKKRRRNFALELYNWASEKHCGGLMSVNPNYKLTGSFEAENATSF